MKFLIFFLRTKAKLKPVGLVKSCIGEVGQELNRYSQTACFCDLFDLKNKFFRHSDCKLLHLFKPPFCNLIDYKVILFAFIVNKPFNI